MTYNRPINAERGHAAEQTAERYLSARGLQPRARNYRCKAGEIDLIMADGDTLVFVEVRLRRHRRFASAAETVDWRKQRKLTRAAQHFLQRHRLTDRVACRFDVIACDPDRSGQDALHWIPDAFSTV